MKEGKPAVKLWTLGIIAIGLSVLYVSIAHIFQTGLRHNLGWIVLVPIIVGLGYFGSVNMPGLKAAVNISDAVIFLCLIMFGGPAGVIIGSVDAAIHSLKTAKKVTTYIYNISNIAISVFVSSSIVDYLFPNIIGNRTLDFEAARLIVPLFLLGLIYFAINFTLVAVRVASRQQSTLFRVWRENFLWVAVSITSNGSTAGIVSLLIAHVHFYVILIAAPIIVVIFFTYKVYRDKVENSTKHLEELSSLYNQVSHSKAEWESTFNAMSDVILLYDCDGKLNRINNAGLVFEKVDSIEKLQGRHCCELGITCDLEVCRVKEAFSTGKQDSSEIDRYDRTFLITGDPLLDEQLNVRGVVFILKDVTEQKRLREQLMQSEKMSAVGQLVSGVAHELNNPLTSIIGYSELAQMDANLDESTRKHLDTVVHESMRARKIVQNLLTFARQHKPEKNLTDVRAVLERVVELRAYEMRVHSINIETDIQDLPAIMCDGPQLQQVFLNIIINAEQAMLESKGRGNLTVKAEMTSGQIVISIQDDGPGIAPEDINKIFDPFFTTKEVGKGTGLGLSICYGIVQEHGGKLRVKSRPGEGATFFIELPAITKAPEVVAAPVEVEQARISPKSILVVDDEDFIADIVRGVLEREGHRVITANNGAAALDLLDRGQYDLILTDIKMPELSGYALYEKVRDKDQKLAERMIFMTGDMVNSETNEFLQRTGNQYIPKPFAVDELLKSVNQAVSSHVPDVPAEVLNRQSDLIGAPAY